MLSAAESPPVDGSRRRSTFYVPLSDRSANALSPNSSELVLRPRKPATRTSSASSRTRPVLTVTRTIDGPEKRVASVTKVTRSSSTVVPRVTAPAKDEVKLLSQAAGQAKQRRHLPVTSTPVTSKPPRLPSPDSDQDQGVHSGISYS